MTYHNRHTNRPPPPKNPWYLPIAIIVAIAITAVMLYAG